MNYNYDARKDLDNKHINDPIPGDYWNEMFSPIALVIAVDGDDVRCLYKATRVGYSRWTWDTTQVKTMNKAEFKKWLSYGSIPGTWCSVVPNFAHWREFADKSMTYAETEYDSWSPEKRASVRLEGSKL